jgi:hypothetical protein
MDRRCRLAFDGGESDKQGSEPMRNGLPTAVVAMTTASLLAPAVAEAHHVAGGSATCTLVGDVPTINATASFVGFADDNKPIAGELDVDGKKVLKISGFTFAGSDATWQSGAITSTPGTHHVTGQFTWPHQDNMNGSFSADVTCPAPPKPTPSPTPTPSATPTPTPTPTTPTPTTPAPTSTPSTSSPTTSAPDVAPPASGAVEGVSVTAPRCVARKLGRYRITVTPKGALHGLVTFHLKGHGARNVRWFVDTRVAGKSGKSWEWIHDQGRAYSIYLWARPRWGFHLWGRHTVEARFQVENSCGKLRAVRAQLLYFNHDPRPDDPIFAH